MAATLTAKQMRQLLQNISADPQLKQSQDSILLAEDQYPDALEAIFTRLTTPTTMQNTMNLLQWNRKTESGAFDAELKASTIVNQDYLRTTYQLVPTGDNPWDTNTFRRWKYFVTNLCLSAVQDALKASDTSKNLQYLFAPETKRTTRQAQPGNRKATYKDYSYITPYCYHHPGKHRMTLMIRSRRCSQPLNQYFLLDLSERMGTQPTTRTMYSRHWSYSQRP